MSSNEKMSQSVKFSSYHPMIPKSYTPSWKQDMVNRDTIRENVTLSRLPYTGTQTSLYLEKRERLSAAEPRDSINSKVSAEEIASERVLQPWFHSPLSKYQSTLMFRIPGENK